MAYSPITTILNVGLPYFILDILDTKTSRQLQIILLSFLTFGADCPYEPSIGASSDFDAILGDYRSPTSILRILPLFLSDFEEGCQRGTPPNGPVYGMAIRDPTAPGTWKTPRYSMGNLKPAQ